MNSLSALGFFRSDSNGSELGALSQNSYENIFRTYQTENKQDANFYYYNILNSIYMPKVLPNNAYYTITLQRSLPWTVISYNEYKTTDLWWLIVLTNGIINPVMMPGAGTVLKIIRQEYIPTILDNIKLQLDQ
jgi:hypothetical protein